jgi:hypothetical protein
LNLVGLILIGCARLSRNYIQIKNFLNSYRAGAPSNLVTLDASTLFSEGEPHEIRKVSNWSCTNQELMGKNIIISLSFLFFIERPQHSVRYAMDMPLLILWEKLCGIYLRAS